jgi:diacylglycerol kinase (ATP)
MCCPARAWSTRLLADGDAAMICPHKGRTGVDRLIRATRNSLVGLAAAWREESAFRQEAVLAIALAPLGLWLGSTWVERALLWGSLLLVLIVELLNTGIEAAIDRVSADTHQLSAKAKDVASAAVMLSLVLCAGIWLGAAAGTLTR